MPRHYASAGQSVRKRQMKRTWQIWEIMFSSNTISGTLGCHFGSNRVPILARSVHICSVESIRAWTEELMESLKGSNALLWHHILCSNRTTKQVSGLKRGGPCRCWRDPVGVPLTCVATATAAAGKKNSPLERPINTFLYTLECVFSCVYFSVATNLPAGGWSNYQSGLP